MNEKLVDIGFCVKPHGVRGGLIFHLSNQEESILRPGNILTLFPKSNQSSIESVGKRYTLESISFGNKVIAYLEGVANRNQVEELLPFFIKIPRDSFPALDDGEYYLSDLIGLKAYENGIEVGEVVDGYDNGAQTILCIKGKKEFEVPFVDQYVPKVEIEKGKLEVVVPIIVE